MAPPKGSGQRKSSGSVSKVSSPLGTEKSSKPSKPSKIIQLRLSKSSLLRFPHEPLNQKSAPKKKSPLSISTPARDPTPPLPESKSESSETPAPSQDAVKVEPARSEEPIKKEIDAPKTGSKRALGAGVDEPVKQKGKPGPKKKPRLEDGTIVHTKTTKGPAPGPNHKLGPKANQGAINAGLRALDRTGKPCRKWTKSGFNLKTFTGVTWEIPSWRGPKPMLADGNRSTSDGTSTSNSQSKAEKSISNAESERSQPDDVPAPDQISSPALVAATA